MLIAVISIAKMVICEGVVTLDSIVSHVWLNLVLCTGLVLTVSEFR